MYAPTIGQFIEEDPIGLDGDDENLYRRQRELADPEGHWRRHPRGAEVVNPWQRPTGSLESLHSPVPVTLHTAAVWRERLMDTGLRVDWMDEPLFERAEGRSLQDWSARAGLSQAGFEEARDVLRGAPDSVRRYLRVLVHGEDLQLHWPLAIIAAKRVN